MLTTSFRTTIALAKCLDKSVIYHQLLPFANESSEKITISNLLNTVFAVYNPPINSPRTILTEDNNLQIQIGPSPLGLVDSTVIFHTEVENIRKQNLSNYPQSTQKKFREAMREEIEFLLKDTVNPINPEDVEPNCEIQPLKWVLNIKRSPNSSTSVRHRARLVSASHQTELRHSVHGNAPTVGLHTIRITLSLFPTWKQEAAENGKELSLFTRDVPKAFLQSMPSKRLVFYEPPKEYFELYPGNINKIWKAKTQLSGDVEAGLYWNKTFVPWICQNILDLRQSIYDPSLLYSPTRNTAMMLCTDDTLNVIHKHELNEEEKISMRFECRGREYPPTDFKGVEINEFEKVLSVSQNSYAKKMIFQTIKNDKMTKPELHRPINTDELKIIRSDAGKLAWLATGTCQLAAFQASVALQTTKENPRTVETLIKTREKLNQIHDGSLANITFSTLHELSIHIRVYSDAAFQNLKTKHSQIGFLFALSDINNTFNLFHWHSSRAPRRPHSTEESEMLALDAAIRAIRNMRMIVFELLKRTVPVVCYVDNESLWINLMNITAHSLPEVAFRCREAIEEKILTNVCLIEGKLNPADAMTKRNDNGILKECLERNICETIPKRIFMKQTSKFRNATFIPTAKLPMVKTKKN